jgi:hypothetical protein
MGSDISSVIRKQDGLVPNAVNCFAFIDPNVVFAGTGGIKTRRVGPRQVIALMNDAVKSWGKKALISQFSRGKIKSYAQIE